MTETAKVCKCGAIINDPKYNTCRKCFLNKQTMDRSLPPDYLTKGYFDEKGNLYIDLVGKTASDIALKIGGKMGNAQLRKFYGHAKRAYNRIKNGIDFETVSADIQKLMPFAVEAKSKDKINDTFLQFFEINIPLINDKKSFTKGFMQHFEAIVAYFTYHYKGKE